MTLLTLSIEVIEEIHNDILEEYGGLHGICPDKSLESALHRIENYSSYGNLDKNDIFEMAALYGVILAQGHVFNDGNKRTALICMYTFLELNNYILNATSKIITELMVEVAEKKISRVDLKKWLKDHTKEIKK